MPELTINDVLYEQVFTHIADDGSQTTIAIERLLKKLVAGGSVPCKIAVEHSFALFCRERRGVEQPRVDCLNASVVATNPVLMLDMNDGSHLLADGTHRYVWAAEHGWQYVLAYIVPYADWQEFIVKDVPDAMAKVMVSGPSGVMPCRN